MFPNFSKIIWKPCETSKVKPLCTDGKSGKNLEKVPSLQTCQIIKLSSESKLSSDDNIEDDKINEKRETGNGIRVILKS